MSEMTFDFKNSDEFLKTAVAQINADRKKFSLNGLVGGLNAIIINVEKDKHTDAVQELLDFTGYDIMESFENDDYCISVLKLEGSADILVQYRKSNENPFRVFNLAPKTEKMPNTRLETFVFITKNLSDYVKIQKSRGIEFLSEDIIEKDNYYFIQSNHQPILEYLLD